MVSTIGINYYNGNKYLTLIPSGNIFTKTQSYTGTGSGFPSFNIGKIDDKFPIPIVFTISSGDSSLYYMFGVNGTWYNNINIFRCFYGRNV